MKGIVLSGWIGICLCTFVAHAPASAEEYAKPGDAKNTSDAASEAR